MGYKFLAEDEREENGVSVATIGDIDGDGLADFLIGGATWRRDRKCRNLVRQHLSDQGGRSCRHGA